MFALKPFQEVAITRLKEKFLTLWKLGDHNLNLTFKSPTGSGKTIMMAQFLRDIVSDPRFQNADVGFLWITNSDSLAMQSKNKLFSYYGGASENTLLDLNNLRDGSIPRNGVFFINWQKLVSRAQTNRKLRTEGEMNTTFDEYLEATNAQGREVVLIIDEEHIASSTVLASDLIKNVIKPRIIIGVSATPQTTGVMVEVDRDDVVQEGLIKEKVIFQTEEDLAKKGFVGMDQDEILLTLAYDKRTDLVELYKQLSVDINPLVMIQLPNDDKASNESGGTKQDLVVSFLKSKGVFEHEIAVWLSEDKTNLEDIEKNDSRISYLLFKQAAATGWDCPRASVLVMFREIKNPTFAIQTVGRILRMPLGTHFPKPELNLGYLYTNYRRNEVISGYSRSAENRPAIYGSYRNQSIVPIIMESVFMSRTDYNDLGDSFQKTFAETADRYFDIKTTTTTVHRSLENGGLELEPKVTNGLIVDVEIDDYDNFTKQLITEGGSYDQEISQYDLERLYNRCCFDLISKQIDENKKFAPERSWGKLKTALNIWLRNHTGYTRPELYKVFVYDLILRQDGGVLAPIIGDALATYRTIRESEVNKKSARSKRTEDIEIPRQALFFTDQYEEMRVKKCAMTPFYIEKSYVGEDNEKGFIAFLESHKNVLWWYKNGDLGSEHFSLSYYNPEENKERLFYPDWIVKTKSGAWIIDTKKGSTAELMDTKHKAEALQQWAKAQKGFLTGIAVQDGPNGWKINTEKTYTYTPSLTGWKNLKELL